MHMINHEDAEDNESENQKMIRRLENQMIALALKDFQSGNCIRINAGQKCDKNWHKCAISGCNKTGGILSKKL